MATETYGASAVLKRAAGCLAGAAMLILALDQFLAGSFDSLIAAIGSLVSVSWTGAAKVFLFSGQLLDSHARGYFEVTGLFLLALICFLVKLGHDEAKTKTEIIVPNLGRAATLICACFFIPLFFWLGFAYAKEFEKALCIFAVLALCVSTSISLGMY